MSDYYILFLKILFSNYLQNPRSDAQSWWKPHGPTVYQQVEDHQRHFHPWSEVHAMETWWVNLIRSWSLVSVLISMMYSLCFNQKCWAVVFFHKNITSCCLSSLEQKHRVNRFVRRLRKLTAEVGITFLMETQTISAAGTTLWSPRILWTTLWAIGELRCTDFTDMSLICLVLMIGVTRWHPVTLESPPHQHWTWLFCAIGMVSLLILWLPVGKNLCFCCSHEQWTLKWLGMAWI